MRSSKILRKGQNLIDWKAVGHRIRELRGFDMNQQDFALRVGISQGYLSSMERGEKEIGVEILLRISREYERSLEWLLTGEEQKGLSAWTRDFRQASKKRLNRS